MPFFNKVRETYAALIYKAPTPTLHVAIMRVSVRLLMLLSGLMILSAPNFLFPSRFDDNVLKVPCGWIGLVARYWLS